MTDTSLSVGLAERKSFVRVLRQCADVAGDSYGFSYESPGAEPINVSYAELDQRARSVASWLLAQGLQPGDRVLLALAPGLQPIQAFFGCVYAGLIPVPAPVLQPPFQRLHSILRDAKVAAAIVAHSSRPALEVLAKAATDAPVPRWLFIEDALSANELPWSEPLISDDQPLFLQYTSGSLGAPKGVVVTHRNAWWNCHDIRQPPDTKIVSWLPFYHDFGLVYAVLVPIFAQIPAVHFSQWAFLQRPIRWLDAITRHHATHSPAPNFAFDLCTRTIAPEERGSLDLRSWRGAVIGSEPVRADTLRRFSESFAAQGARQNLFVSAYGLAESTLQVTRTEEFDPTVVLTVDREELGQRRVSTLTEGADGSIELVACGRPTVGNEVRIVEPLTCEPVAAAGVGEIWVRGPSVANGYWQKPAETERVFGGRLANGEGPFLRTGDLGFFHEGQLFVVGRTKEVVIINGVNHYPTDLELTVELAHESLRSSAVVAFGVDQGSSEGLAIVAELDDDSLAQAPLIAQVVRRRLLEEHELAVARLAFISADARACPRTSSGKIRRSACRDALLAGLLPVIYSEGDEADVAEPAGSAARADGPSERPTHILGELQAMIVRLLGRATSIVTTEPLGALGVDSIIVAQFIVEVQRRYAVALDARELARATLADIATQIASGHSKHVQAPLPAAQSPAPIAVEVPSAPRASGSRAPADRSMSVFFFGNLEQGAAEYYRLLLESAQAADRLGFGAVWVPERHFHGFGGLSPNPSVLASALATMTSRMRIRAGSVILPLHKPLRVAEEWSVVDNLSGGRVDIAFGTGWNPNDFVLAPEAFETRRVMTLEGIRQIQDLWAGKAISQTNGVGVPNAVRVFPKPQQAHLNVWLTCSGGVERFIDAGSRGYNVLTALLFQKPQELELKVRMYREARAQAGFDPDAGVVTVMVHTFVAETEGYARQRSRAPFLRYLESSADLWKHGTERLADLTAEVRNQALEVAFERYFAQSLMGDADKCCRVAEQLYAVGVNEVACLIDWGLPIETVLSGLYKLNEVRQRCGAQAAGAAIGNGGVRPFGAESPLQGTTS